MTQQPQLRSASDWVWYLFCGLCMGAADLVPGISGGTIAFIMGYYEPLIHNIKSINRQTISMLLRLRLRELSQVIAWKFLLALLLGIVLALALFSQAITAVLNHETYRVYLFAAFFGLILASASFCGRRIKNWHWHYLAAFSVGVAIAYFLTAQTAAVTGTGEHVESSLINFWIIFCGAIAVSAMLLPGLSGSYLLAILGVYPVVVGALADLVSGLHQFTIDYQAAIILGNLLVGIVIGAALFSRVISWLFLHYHDATIAMLVGFMLGALRAVWPFWTYRYVTNPLKASQPPRLETVEPFLPDLSSAMTWTAIATAVAAFAVVVALELIALKRVNR